MLSMTRAIGVVIAAIIAVGMASATIGYQGLPNDQTGYQSAEYFIHFESGADMVFGGQSGPGAMFTYNNLPLTYEQYQSDLAEGFAAYEAFKNPVITFPPAGTPADNGGIYDSNGNIIYPDDTNVDDTQDGSSGNVDVPVDVTTPDTPADVVPDNTNSNPGKPAESNIQLVEGTDTYFLNGNELHTVHPKYARSVECTVGNN